MTRPVMERNVGEVPGSLYFKPRGIPASELEEVVLTLDEWEALRLADWEGFYQEDAALRMNVSRQTFGNIVASAHRKVAEALVTEKALKIEGTASCCGGKCRRVSGDETEDRCEKGMKCGRRKRFSRYDTRREE